MEVERCAARSAAIKRSRSKLRFKKKKVYPQITRSIYGKEVVVKLSRLMDVNATTGRAVFSHELVQIVQGGNDWTNYAASFQLYNIIKVKVQVMPAMVWVDANLNPTLKACAICYNSKDSTAPTALNQVTDSDQYSLQGMVNTDLSVKHFFKFFPRPTRQPPFPTSSTEQNYGYLKGYSDQILGGDTNPYTGLIIRLLYVFTVVFSGEA